MDAKLIFSPPKIGKRSISGGPTIRQVDRLDFDQMQARRKLVLATSYL